MDVLDYAERALREAGRACHYVEVCQRAQALGWQSDLTKPERAVRRAMRMDIRREGQASRFRQPADATFDLAERHPDYTPLSEVKIGERKPRAGAALTPKRQMATTCGNCAAIEFDGCHEVDQSSGTCGDWERSARLGVRAAEPGCLHWRPRTVGQFVSDRKRRVTALNRAYAAWNEGGKRNDAPRGKRGRR